MAPISACLKIRLRLFATISLPIATRQLTGQNENLVDEDFGYFATVDFGWVIPIKPPMN
jgi:hypothetical protein